MQKPFYVSTKTYGHELGLSCAFRQWRAQSHCRHLHGYALSVRIEFASNYLDQRNWVVDFGGLKTLKKQIQDCFDHTTVVAADDPQLELFQKMRLEGLCSLVVLPHVGCEAFAEHIYHLASLWLDCNLQDGREIAVRSVEVKEHGANSAIYIPEENL